MGKLSKALNEKKLIEQSKKGSGDAFRVLVDRYRDRILNVVYRVTRNKAECEDIAQEVFIKAYTRLSTFFYKSSFYTWLYRIAVNTAMDHCKKLKRKRAISLEEFPVEFADPSSSSGNPVKEVMNKELSCAIDSAFQALSPKYRTILTLREVEGCSYEEISRILGCSKGTVESRLFRARAKLREKMAGYLSPSCDGTPK